MARIPPALHVACSLNDSDKVKKLLSDKQYAKENVNKLVQGKSPNCMLGPLHYAVEKGFTEVVEVLLNNESDVMLLDGEGYTPLHIACSAKHASKEVKITIVKMLLEFGAKVAQCIHKETGYTCLHEVVLSQSLEILELLLSRVESDQRSGFINHCDSKGFSPLHRACIDGLDLITDCLLKYGAYVDNKNKIGRTALHYAAFYGHIKCAEVLIEHNADINVQDEEGWTAVILASQEGSLEIIKLLCEHSADLTLTSNKGRTAVHAACLSGHIKCVHCIFQQPNSEAFISVSDSNGQTPLHVASRYGHLEILKDFLSGSFNNVILDYKDLNGQTPLHYAVINDQCTAAGYLIQMGANISAKDSNAQTPLHIACERGYTRIAKLLVSHGANIDEITDIGRNSLHLAASGGHLVITEFMLNNGINAQLQDNDGWSAMHLATKKDHEIIVDALLKYTNDNINKLVYDNMLGYKIGSLHFSIQNGSIEITLMLLDSGADVMLLDGEGYSPLHRACRTGNVSLAHLLLKRGAEAMHVHKDSGSTPFHKAVCSGSSELVKLLLSYIKSEDIANFCDKDNWSPLHFACDFGFPYITKQLLDIGTQGNSRTKTGRTALHLAASNGFVLCTRHLLKYGVNVDLQDEEGFTAMILASQNNHPKIVQLLCKQGSNSSLTNQRGQNAIHVSCFNGNIECIKHIFEHSCSKGLVSAVGNDGFTPLHLASQEGHLDIVKFLYTNSHPNILQSKAKDGTTPLHCAVIKGKYSTVELLLHMRSEVSARDVKQWTPLHIACNNGHTNIVELLVSYGSNVSNVTDIGRNTLHLAALQGHSFIVEFLQKHGIDCQLRDKHGWSPLHLAVQKGHKKVVQLLLQQSNKNINEFVYDDQFEFQLAPLHLAIKGKFTDVIEVLLQHKADVMLVDSRMYTPFHTACSTGSVYIAKLLLEHGAEVQCVHEDSGSTSLHSAVCSGSHALVEFLLTDNKSEQFINVGDNNLWTPLHFACHNGYHHIAACLLKYGACIDSKTKRGRTAFHLAAIKDHLKCAQVLLEYKVDVRVQDKDGCTALDLASHQCQHELIKLIFDKNPSLIEKITIEHPQFKNTRFMVSMSDSYDGGSATHHFTTQECHLATVEHFFLTEGLAFNRMAVDSTDDNGRTPLYIAVMKNQYDVAKILIEMGADISLSDLNGWTPLHVACKNGHTNNVRLLVFHGADINRVTTIGKHSPLHLAIKGEFIEIIQVFLKEKVDVMLKDHDQYTPLHAACSTGNVFVVKLLLEHGADAKCIHQGSGSTSLHRAVCSGSLELVKLLLSQCKSEESRPFVNLSDKNGWSPLHFACQNGEHHIATCLLKYGANVDSKTNTGRNVMHVSCFYEHVKCIDCILEHLQTFEASYVVTIISTPDNDGMTPLHVASQNGLHKIVKNFLSHKGVSALVNSQDKTGRTPIYLAVMEGRQDVTKTLLKFKSDITLRDSNHWTPLHVACDKGYGKIANLLILKGASVEGDEKREEQVGSLEILGEWSPLHLAIRKGHKDIVELILKHSKQNVDQLVFDKYKSYRPIHLAVEGGFTDIIQVLLMNGAKVMSHNAEVQTPLVVACKTGKTAIAKMLVDNGAKLEYDGYSLTSLHYAVITGSLKLIDLLLSLSNSNKLINCCDYEGISPLHFACQYGYYQITLKLLTSGAKVNNKILKIGRTALHLAAFEGYINCLEALLKFGAAMDIQDSDGWTAVMLASQEGHHEIVKILCERSAKLDLKCHGGRNAAHVACAHGQVKCLECIAEQRNSVKIISDEDENGLTPFHHACKEGHLEIIKFLQSQGLCSEINSKSSKGITPLFCAVTNGRYNVIDLLFQMGFEISMEDVNQMSSFHIASQFGYTKIVELLITKGALINSLTSMGRNGLHLAAFSGQVSTAILLIEKGISYLLKDEDGWTPLHLAAQQGHVSTVEVLLRQTNIQVNCQSENMRTPLHSCSYHGNVLITELLLNKGADLKLQDENGWTALHLCAQQGHIKVVQKLIDKGANPNCQSKTKRAPMHLACMKGRKHVVEYLLKKGAEIDMKDFNLWTPLCDACQDNHADIVDLLIKYKANVNTKIASGRTSLHLVAFKGFLDACKLLLNSAININSKDNEGWTALHLAAQEGFLKIVELLDKHHADLEATANDGRTPLDMCSASGHVKIVEYLISRGAKFKKPDIIYHWTPFHWACKFGHLEVAEILLAHKASINDVTLGGHSALHLCILDGHTAVAEFLIKRGINVEIVDKDGKTALHFACEYGHEDITELLLKTQKFKIDAVDNKKWTPLHYACNNSQESSTVVYQLLNHCNIYLCTDSGKNCLHLAALNGGIDVCKLLLKNDKERKLLKCQDEYGWSPLHLASYTGRLDIVELFVTKYKADVTVSSIYGWTPLHLAILMYNSDVQNFLSSKESALDLESLSRFIKSLFEKDKKQLDMIRKHFLGVEAARLPVERKKKAETSTPSPEVASADAKNEEANMTNRSVTINQGHTSLKAESGSRYIQGISTSSVQAKLLNDVIDSQHDNVSKHLGQIADAMYEWEGPIAEQLGLTRADIAAIKTQHPTNLRLQTREALEKWKQMQGFKATYNNLIKVFKDAGYKDIADTVMKVITGYDDTSGVRARMDAGHSQ